VAVRLTPKGERRAKAVLARREHELAEVLSPLSDAERGELTRLHEKLLAELPDGVPGARRVCRFCDVHACGHHEGRCPVTQGIDARGLRA
jgi:Mn-dependent DtxR family transcriptional regulator